MLQTQVKVVFGYSGNRTRMARIGRIKEDRKKKPSILMTLFAFSG